MNNFIIIRIIYYQKKACEYRSGIQNGQSERNWQYSVHKTKTNKTQHYMCRTLLLYVNKYKKRKENVSPLTNNWR